MTTNHELAAAIATLYREIGRDSLMQQIDRIETMIAEHVKQKDEDIMLHSKLRVELITLLKLDSLPPRGDNSRIFEAIEKLYEATW